MIFDQMSSCILAQVYFTATMYYDSHQVSLPIPSWEEYWWSWVINSRINRTWYVSNVVAAGIMREEFEAYLQLLAFKWKGRTFARNMKAKMMIAWYKCVGMKSFGRQSSRQKQQNMKQYKSTMAGLETIPKPPNRTDPCEPKNIRLSRWMTGRSLCNSV